MTSAAGWSRLDVYSAAKKACLHNASLCSQPLYLQITGICLPLITPSLLNILNNVPQVYKLCAHALHLSRAAANQSLAVHNYGPRAVYFAAAVVFQEVITNGILTTLFTHQQVVIAGLMSSGNINLQRYLTPDGGGWASQWRTIMRRIRERDKCLQAYAVHFSFKNQSEAHSGANNLVIRVTSPKPEDTHVSCVCGCGVGWGRQWWWCRGMCHRYWTG